MKKISTLLLASLFTMAAFASDRRPSVTVQASKNYQVVIDGTTYTSGYGSTMNITNLRDGYHTVKVYSNSRLFILNIKRMVSSSSFMLRGNDVSICVDQFGRIQVTESKGWGRDNRNWDKKGQDFNKGYGDNRDNHGGHF